MNSIRETNGNFDSCNSCKLSCTSQNFRLFHVSNLSVRNCRIFLLMYYRVSDKELGSARPAGAAWATTGHPAFVQTRQHSAGASGEGERVGRAMVSGAGRVERGSGHGGERSDRRRRRRRIELRLPPGVSHRVWSIDPRYMSRKFQSLERINLIRETNCKFDTWNELNFWLI